MVEAETGAVLAAEAANHLWYPASLTKLMTVYVALSEIEAGRLRFGDKITVSPHAAGQNPVKFGLRPGQIITKEFNAQRLNLEVDANGRIVAVRCG